jgi:hypothetical protein
VEAPMAEIRLGVASGLTDPLFMEASEMIVMGAEGQVLVVPLSIVHQTMAAPSRTAELVQ